MRKGQVLTTEQAAEIRRRYTGGGVTQGQLALSFNVSRTMISMITGGHRYTGGPGRIYTRQADPEDRVCRLCDKRKPIAEFQRVVWKKAHGRRGEYAWRETRCRDCARSHQQKTLAHNDPDRMRRRRGYRTLRKKARDAVLDHYGRRCTCCGETEKEFLGVDHIHGGGLKHRRSLGAMGKGTQFYRWIVQNGYPSDLRILCWNCNLARGFYGLCPHEVERAAEVTQDARLMSGESRPDPVPSLRDVLERLVHVGTR